MGPAACRQSAGARPHGSCGAQKGAGGRPHGSCSVQASSGGRPHGFCSVQGARRGFAQGSGPCRSDQYEAAEAAAAAPPLDPLPLIPSPLGRGLGEGAGGGGWGRGLGEGAGGGSWGRGLGTGLGAGGRNEFIQGLLPCTTWPGPSPPCFPRHPRRAPPCRRAAAFAHADNHAPAPHRRGSVRQRAGAARRTAGARGLLGRDRPPDRGRRPRLRAAGGQPRRGQERGAVALRQARQAERAARRAPLPQRNPGCGPLWTKPTFGTKTCP